MFLRMKIFGVPVFKILRALAARLLFSIHALIAIWRVASLYQDGIFWLFVLVIVAMFVEGILNVLQRQGAETRWFCPCIFLYLCCTVPPIWFLELKMLAGRIEERDLAMLTHHKQNHKETMTDLLDSNFTDTDYQPEEILIEIAEGVKVHFTVHFQPEKWVQFLEQTMMVVLIIGRWLLPKGEISRQQLSQLLLVYLGTAADIVELFELFKEEAVAYDWELATVVLIVWSVSLIQFSLVITTAKSGKKPRFGGLEDDALLNIESQSFVRKSSSGSTKTTAVLMIKRKSTSASLANKALSQSQSADDIIAAAPIVESGNFVMVELDPVWKVLLRDVNVWGIFISIMLQDGPFLSLRMHIITNYHVTSYSMLFFTCKNVLICTLLIYRLVVIVHETIRRRRELLKTPQPSEPPPTPPPEKDDVFEYIDEEQPNADGDGRDGDEKNGVAKSKPFTPMIDEQSIENEECITQPTITSENGSVVFDRTPEDANQQQVGAVAALMGSPIAPMGAIDTMQSPAAETPNDQKACSPIDVEENFSDYDDLESPRPPTFTLDDL